MWDVSDHACRICLGRVLTGTRDGIKVSRCAECGREAEGGSKSICCCGVRAKGGRDAGFRCIKNPARRSGFDAEIICVQGALREAEEPVKDEWRQSRLDADVGGHGSQRDPLDG